MVTWQGKNYADWREARAAMVAPRMEAATAIAEPAPEREIDGPLVAERETPKREVSLSDKHRPRRLADVAGQPAFTKALTKFMERPRSAAFLFHGYTGTGKTSAAWAIAGELGCDLDQAFPEWGGLHCITSGEHTADTLREMWPQICNRPFSGSGWNVLVVNETESLNPAVERLWMDKLENLPERAVIVFTTNNLDSLADRFKDRMFDNTIEFESDAGRMEASARQLMANIWRKETGQDIPADVLKSALRRSISGGKLSLRRAVQSLSPMLAERQA